MLCEVLLLDCTASPAFCLLSHPYAPIPQKACLTNNFNKIFESESNEELKHKKVWLLTEI